MPTWGKPEAFFSRGLGSTSRATMKDRYPTLWADLQGLQIGVTDATSSMETIALLLEYVKACHERIDQLELEKDLT